jgi:hypothetical protein
MKKLFAVMIAGLFATSVYAQTPTTAAPVAPTAIKAEAGAKVATPEAKAHAHKTVAKAHNKAKVHAKAGATAVKADVKVPAIK